MRMKDYYIFKELVKKGSYGLNFNDLYKFRRVLRLVETIPKGLARDLIK